MRKQSLTNYRILSLSLDAEYGKNDAPTIHGLELARAMSKEVSTITFVMRGDKNLDETLDNFNISVVKTPGKSSNFVIQLGDLLIKNMQFYKRGKKYITVSDCIYERHNILSLSGILLSKFNKVPLFFELNSLNAEETLDEKNINNTLLRGLVKRLMRWQLKQASHIFVQTEELKDLIIKLYDVKAVSIIPNGATLHPFIKKTRLNTPLRFIYVGAIDDYHLINDLLSVFARQKTDLSLTIIGTGPMLDEYKQEYAASKNIIFKGRMPHDQVFKYIEASDVGLARYNLASPHFKKYGFYFCPIKILEYAACGKPTIYIGEPNSFVKQLQTLSACMVLKNIDKLNEYLASLEKSTTTITKMSHAAKNISSRFTWDNAAIQTLGVING